MKLRTRRAVSTGILATKDTKLKRWPGRLGNNYGTIKVPGSDNKVYVRVAGKGTVEAFNSIAGLTFGLAVIVGYSKEDPDKLQILSVRTSQPAGIGGDAGIPYAPASRYRWMDVAGGEDPVYIELRQFMPLRPGMGGGMLLQIYRGIVWTGSAFAVIATQSISLATYIPTIVGKAALVLVTIDNTGTVICTKSSEDDISDVPTMVIPTPPANTVTVLAAVRVYFGQLEILEARSNTDLVDLRLSGWVISETGTIGDHDHSGDVGDGGQFPLINLESTGALDGQVPAADGSGGITWETPSSLNDTIGDLFLYVDGVLVAGAGVGLSYIITKEISLGYVYIHCKNKGSSGSTIVDVNKNGKSIFTYQANRPELSYNATNGVEKSGAPSIVFLHEYDVLSFDIDQVAAGASGLSIIVQLMSEASISFPEGWSYRRRVSILNNTAISLTDYQVPVELDFLAEVESGKINSDLSDIGVTDSDGSSPLSYYRETNGNDLGNFNNWNRWQENPVLSGTPSAWDAFWVHPHSIIDNGGTLYLYYGGSPDFATGSPNKTGLATSADGITWSKSGSNPIVSPGASGAWDDTRIDHFTVLKEGSNWYAWYAGDGGDGVWKIGYATSNNGISWTKYGSNPVITRMGATWESGGVIPSCVFKEGSTYYMIYWGYTDGSDNTTWKIGLATSVDRITWVKSDSNPVFAGDTGEWDDGVLDCHVVKIGSTYYMFYQGNTSDQNNSAIGLATSTDLITWTRDADNPISKGANSGEWDYGWFEGPLLYQFGDTWFMYYMGALGGGNYTKSIGLMKFQPTRLWVKVPNIPASGQADIWVYYGNDEASDESDGANTFIFFDDFSGGTPFSQWTNTGTFTGVTDRGDEWAMKDEANTSANYIMITSDTFAPPFIAECRRAKVGADWDSEYGWNYQLAIVDTPGANWNGVEFGHYKDVSNDNYYFRRFVNGSSTHTDIQARAIHAYIQTELAIYVASAGSLIGKVHDGFRMHSIAQNPPASTFALQLLTGRGGGVSDYITYFDKVWVRAYAATDPTATVGEEEASA